MMRTTCTLALPMMHNFACVLIGRSHGLCVDFEIFCFTCYVFVLMGKYEEVSYKGRRYNWPFWLIPLLAVLLFVVVGLFIFVTLDSSHRFGCLFGCEETAVLEPKSTEKTASSKSDGESVLRSEQVQDTKGKAMIQITGKLRFPADNTPKSLPAKSHLKVEFEDVSLADASSEVLGSTVVDLTNYKKGEDLEYAIKCKKPAPHGMFSVSAVLNVGWAPTKDEWIRKGDYFTDTNIPVDIDDGKSKYEADIDLKMYS